MREEWFNQFVMNEINKLKTPAITLSDIIANTEIWERLILNFASYLNLDVDPILNQIQTELNEKYPQSLIDLEFAKDDELAYRTIYSSLYSKYKELESRYSRLFWQIYSRFTRPYVVVFSKEEIIEDIKKKS